MLMVGLGGAGKTTILQKLDIGEIVTTTPTAGFNVEPVQYKSAFFTAWDIRAQAQFRPFWSQYLKNAHGIIFVVDSNDHGRLSEAREELQRILMENELRGLPLLIFANKQDLPDALNTPGIVDQLGLHSISPRKWFIQATCATSNDGIAEGFDWLATAIRRHG
ncbi:unnamed protein product [Rhizoctonia solani]|uniref:ADP-ribosylation factor n=1 Tax=Rhizoctonia solani TaxID=456999 RepID=A0A8H2X3G9_9AGAM|nr:unnamed protein product [Rhizoctonia solani]